MSRAVTCGLLLLTCLSGREVAQAWTGFGINAGVALPTQELAITQDLGVQIGVIQRVFIGGPSFAVALGAYYTAFDGKPLPDGGPSPLFNTDFEAFRPWALFLGPHIGMRDNAYFLPAATANIEGDWQRAGVDITLGALIPFGRRGNKVDVAAKFSVMNIWGREPDEKLKNAFRFGVGLVF